MTSNRASTLDVAACAARGVVVTNTESNRPIATAELAFALILACARSLPQGHANTVAGRWQEGLPIGTTLDGKRLGIVGLGRPGSTLARFGKAFNMAVVAWSTSPTSEMAADRV